MTKYSFRNAPAAAAAAEDDEEEVTVVVEGWGPYAVTGVRVITVRGAMASSFSSTDMLLATVAAADDDNIDNNRTNTVKLIE